MLKPIRNLQNRNALIAIWIMGGLWGGIGTGTSGIGLVSFVGNGLAMVLFALPVGWLLGQLSKVMWKLPEPVTAENVIDASDQPLAAKPTLNRTMLFALIAAGTVLILSAFNLIDLPKLEL